MELRKALQNFAKVAADEAERNPEFEQRIRESFGIVRSSCNFFQSRSY